MYITHITAPIAIHIITISPHNKVYKSMVHLILRICMSVILLWNPRINVNIQNLNSFEDSLVDFVQMIIPVTPV